MKQTILIATGTVLILAVCGVWVYLLIFGTPESAQEFFTSFGGEETAREFIPTSNTGAETTIAIGNTALEQITTRPVAGYAFIEPTSTTSTPVIMYAEQGTGHVYEIDLDANTEERVLGKTFSTITDAVFAPDGSAVVLVSENGYGHTAYLEEVPDGDEILETHALNPNAENISFVGSDGVRYTEIQNNELVGYAYNLTTKETTERFRLPFTDATVLWRANRTLVYNNPAPLYQGGLYQINGTELSRIGETNYALSAIAHPFTQQYVLTRADTETDLLLSTVFIESGEAIDVPITMLPEKCVFDPTNINTLWCASPVDTLPRTYQADWYKGLVQSEDLLWRVDIAQQEARVLLDPLTYTGRAVDVTDITIDTDASHLLFKNKIDDTLWLYTIRTSDSEEPEEAATTTATE